MARYLEVTLPTAPEALDGLAARLVADDFDSFQYTDDSITVYLPEDRGDELQRLRKLCPGLTAAARDEEDWANAWKQYYHPTHIGKRLLIQPAWLPVENPEGRAVFLNDPGMAFGTGLHASTQLCLELLDARIDAAAPPGHVLDVGCGSGILGLCALLLGAESAAGIDMDPAAARAAAENARLNGVRFTVLTGDYLNDEALRGRAGSGFDLIFSNIVADVIIQLAPLIACRLAPGGLWAVSGIVAPRWEEVQTAAEQAGFELKTLMDRDGWTAAGLVLP